MIYRFDRFNVDDAIFRLTADGEPVSLEPKTLRLLLYLIQNPGRLLRKQEILDAVWADAAVTENALTRSIGLLRKALDDDSREPRFIETVPTAGYRFIAAVETLPAPTAEPDQPVAEVTSPTASPVHRLHLWRIAAILACCLLLLAATGWLAAKRIHSAPIHSLAVLPLENLSGDPSQEYFADGMTDELITDLARIPSLLVVSRTSVMQEKGVRKPLPEIARELNVDAIVEGSVVRSGDRVRITAQLIDARTDRHLWAQSFEGPATDVLSVQDSVARQIAQQARLVLVPPPPRPPLNPAAHDAYLRGRYFYNKRDAVHSADAFEQAIALDPNYASAYAGLADALESEMTLGNAPADVAMPKALAAAERAIQLDPENGEAYSALGSVQFNYYWDWPSAERNLVRSLELSPSYALGEMRYATFLTATGRTEEAISHMRRALELDPLSFFMNRHLGSVLYIDRRYDEAIQQLQRASEMEPHHSDVVDNWISWAYEKKNMYDQAVPHDLAAIHDAWPNIDVASLRSAYQNGGWSAYNRARIDALRPYTDTNCYASYEQAATYLRLNDRDNAIAFLNRAFDQHCYWLVLLKVDPLFDSVRNDRRYAALLRRLNLPS